MIGLRYTFESEVTASPLVRSVRVNGESDQVVGKSLEIVISGKQLNGDGLYDRPRSCERRMALCCGKGHTVTRLCLRIHLDGSELNGADSVKGDNDKIEDLFFSYFPAADHL